MAQTNFQRHFAHLLPILNDQHQPSPYPTAPPQAPFLADLLSTSDITPDFHSTILEQPSPTLTTLTTESETNAYIDNKLHHFNGKKGGRQIALNGHRYVFDRSTASSADWWYCCCKNNKSIKCKARVQTLGTEILVQQEHNHSADIPATLAAMHLHKIKEAALCSDTPLSVVRAGLVDAPADVKSKLPKCSNIAEAVRRERRKKSHHPTTPNSALEIVITDKYKVCFLSYPNYTFKLPFSVSVKVNPIAIRISANPPQLTPPYHRLTGKESGSSSLKM